MTPEQLLRDAENELAKARAFNTIGLAPEVENILDALALMINAQTEILAMLRKTQGAVAQ